MRSVEAVNGVMFTVLFPITFLANTFAPTEPMQHWLRVIAEWNPVSSLAQAMRELWGNGGPAPAERPTAAAPSGARDHSVVAGVDGGLRAVRAACLRAPHRRLGPDRVDGPGRQNRCAREEVVGLAIRAQQNLRTQDARVLAPPRELCRVPDAARPFEPRRLANRYTVERQPASPGTSRARASGPRAPRHVANRGPRMRCPKVCDRRSAASPGIWHRSTHLKQLGHYAPVPDSCTAGEAGPIWSYTRHHVISWVVAEISPRASSSSASISAPARFSTLRRRADPNGSW